MTAAPLLGITPDECGALTQPVSRPLAIMNDTTEVGAPLVGKTHDVGGHVEDEELVQRLCPSECALPSWATCLMSRRNCPYAATEVHDTATYHSATCMSMALQHMVSVMPVWMLSMTK